MKLFVALCSFCLFYAAEAKAANFHADQRLEQSTSKHFCAAPDLTPAIIVANFETAAPRVEFQASAFLKRAIPAKDFFIHTGLSPPPRS